MNIHDITEDKLNLFIDEQLDTDEMDDIREALLDDKELRERVCQLKAVRELLAYAYTEVPGSGIPPAAGSAGRGWLRTARRKPPPISPDRASRRKREARVMAPSTPVGLQLSL